MKTIDITISPTGQSHLETRGFAGNECKAASRYLESALGSKTSETLTSEFHQTQTEQQSQCKSKSGTVFFPPIS